MKTLKFLFNFPGFPASRLTVLSSLLLLFSPALFAQREADNWILNGGAGLNFTTGDPVPLFVNSPVGFHDGAIMSDTLGNILFYFDGNRVYNRNDEVMLNGDGILPEHPGGWGQSAIAFPKPNSDVQYYIFSITDYQYPDGLYYSIVDMTLDGGLGGVTAVKNVKLTAASSAAEHLFALKNSDGNSYWVITRLIEDDRYACFKVDATGVDPVPVYSPTGIHRDYDQSEGPTKVSPDKKYLVSCFMSHYIEPLTDFEVCSFDAETGKIDFFYYISLPNNLGGYAVPQDCEFSPDSKYLYIAYINLHTWSGGALFQYNMQLAADSAAFYDSGIMVRANAPWSIQLSNDGRIYGSCLADTCGPPWYEYISVINKPWKFGAACDFDTLSVYCGGRHHNYDCPNFLLDYLYRFEWTADDYCQGSPVHFLPHFVPTPDSVKWSFGEFATGNTSTELSPTYTFKYPGIHEISVDIWYPTGRFEHTSREIEIFPTPHPDLGPDLVICEGTSDTLYANCDADFYSWNGIPGTSHYIISDSGFYRVTVSFLETGCSGSDTIHVGFYPPVKIDESSLVITPTTCNGASGSITGLDALGSMPLAYQWQDLSGNDYGTSLDLFNLPAGQYILTIIDGNGCETISSAYTIEDAGNLSVTLVQVDLPHCYRPDGQIIITAFSPIGSSLLYSIDDGVTYQADSVFSGLTAASYVVRVKDENSCEGFYPDNPVVLEDIPGPQVIQVNVTDETDFLGNGAIEIIASGSTPVVYYSIDGGNTWQLNDGNFYNLQSGVYNLQVKDENGCDTAFTVEIENIILTYLQAITGPGEHCLGDAVTIPIEVENFKSVASFRLQLSFNKDNLQCEGYTNADPQLQQNLTGWVDQAAGQITFQWQDTVALTYSQPDTVAELVFTSKQPGLGDIGWYTGATESYFTNISGSTIPAEFHTGEVNIYEPPSILLSASKSVCEGQSLSIMSIATGNHPPFSFQWTYPGGQVTENDPFLFNVTQADAGDYVLLATDMMGCTDQKTIRVDVGQNPVAAFHGTDTLEMHSGDYLDAGAGMASYSWNTGDTIEYTIVYTEGMYSVDMESLAGCTGKDSIYIKLTSDEIPSNFIFIPNAFSPDNDGLNDIFMAYATSDYIQKFHMLIFDRWGGQIFESNDIMLGWDGTKHGTPLPGGMYTYKITYSIYPSLGDYTEQVRFGTVMLVR
jgi:gliding motility-associated-like protein